MPEVQSFPSHEVCVDRANKTPNFMRPNVEPWFVWVESYLTGDQCDAILADFEEKESYEFHPCLAQTKEIIGHTAAMQPVYDLTRAVNLDHWNFTLDQGPVGCWLQSYLVGDSYKLHQDAGLGQCRKLTAVVMLSNFDDYEGGHLRFFFPPDHQPFRETRGTIFVFPAWQMHDVTPVERGKRQSLNMGFYGPQFV